MALTAQDKATIADIVRAVIAEAPAEDAPKQARASQVATAFPEYLTKNKACAAGGAPRGKHCAYVARTVEGAATHLATNAPRDAKGHRPVWVKNPVKA